MRSCLDVYKASPNSTANGIYLLINASVYCDMLNGGWSLIAKFTDSGDWVYSSNRWIDKSTFNVVLDPLSVSSAKSYLWSTLPFTYLRLDVVGKSEQSVTLKNPTLQTMYNLMNTPPVNLMVVNGSINNFPIRNPGFQGGVGNTSNGRVMTNFIANSSTYGFSSWLGCNTCINKVRFGAVYGGGLNVNDELSGAVNVGFFGLGGTTSYKDGCSLAAAGCIYPGTCNQYSQPPETNFDTSGFNGNLWVI